MRSAMCAASQLPGKGPTDVDDAPAHHHIIIGFLINVQVQGHHPHQWAPFQVTG